MNTLIYMIIGAIVGGFGAKLYKKDILLGVIIGSLAGLVFSQGVPYLLQSSIGIEQI